MGAQAADDGCEGGFNCFGGDWGFRARKWRVDWRVDWRVERCVSGLCHDGKTWYVTTWYERSANSKRGGLLDSSRPCHSIAANGAHGSYTAS